MKGMKAPKEVLTELKEILLYDEVTGELRWKKFRGGRGAAGKPLAGKLNNTGYYTIGINGKVYLRHRVIWALYHGYWPENQIDHINRDKTDNRISNLREVSHSCNTRNAKLRVDCTSGIKGVLFHSGINRWTAVIRCKGRKYNLVTTTDKVEAVAARLAAEQHLKWYECDSQSSAKKFMEDYLLLGDDV